ncbi:MAG: glycosyltransferase family 39 protein [Chloroflexi bacterium]|nr:glycosyltransferase family 39 protein [Chloroflexota bacterium]
MKVRRHWWLALAGAVIVASGMMLVDPRGDAVRAWLAYGVVAAACAGLLIAALRTVGREAPAGVLAAVLIALVLRLIVGAVLLRVLPVYGYETDPQKAGYVYWDSYKRDTDAWNISRMDEPLAGLAAARTTSDQYLGLVTFSAGLYRMLSPDAHRPLLIVELAALASALGVLFAWAFGRSTFGDRVGVLAAWGMALYPESVLLGSSQMREPFLIGLYAAGFFGYALERQGRRRSGLAWMAAAVVLALPLSPPSALALLLALLGAWLWEGRSRLKGRWLALAAAGSLVLVALFLMARAWSSIGDLGTLGVDAIARWWTQATDTWRTSLLIEGSPIIGFFLKMFPAWAQMPLITGYGLLLPLLPAALADVSNPVWWTIAVFRALGWTALIPFLIASLVLVLQQRKWRELQVYLLAIITASALLAAMRASSLQWDNPRYRAILLFAQVTLAAWAWEESRQRHSAWLWRIALIEAVDLLLILWWYAGRYWGMPQIGLSRTLIGLAVLTVGLLAALVGNDVVRRRREGRLTPPSPKV